MPVELDEFIERRILTGLIVSTDYIREINSIWQSSFLESATARLLSNWCLEYYRQYNEAPGKNIETIFVNKIKEGLSDQQVEDIESILDGLSAEYEHQDNFNVTYLLDQTKKYLNQQNLKLFTDQIQDSLRAGEIVEAEQLANSYMPLTVDQISAIDPFESASRIKQAFEYQTEPLIYFPKALGAFWNTQLVRDAFVALIGPEKRGKTFWLMELAIRGIMSAKNVVFFQAGDMSENQQLRRLCIYLAKRSDKEFYCNARFVPCTDCWYNQTDTCNREERECDFGLFPDGTDQNTITKEMLENAYENEPDYKPCHNCPHMKGAVWLKWKESVKPLDWKQAYKIAKKWRRKHNSHFKLSTYPNDTLSVQEIKNLLDIWEKQEGFVPDIIIIDYADIMAPDSDCSRLDRREQHNKLWQRLRKLSQEKHCLVVTATQAAATSYGKTNLTLNDFSEDKRKIAHVTAMYGLNQTPEEKKLGIMRLSKLAIREEEFDTVQQVKVLQCLQKGRPFIGSYF